MVFYITVRLVYLTLDIHAKENLIIDDHIFYLLNMVLFCILLPLYYINQVPTLKLYVSVYHHQPPPVLPWQVPEHFDPSVHLTVVQWKNRSGSPVVLQYKNLQILKASVLAMQTICPENIPKKRLKTLSECE